MKTGFPSSENVFSNEFFIPASGKDFLSSGKSSLLFRDFLKFLKFGDSNFLKRNLILARGN